MGLQGRRRGRARPRTTDSRHGKAPAPNRLAQLPPPTGPDQVWVTDITYIKTGEGWLYLAAILDLWSRRIVGWACAPTLHASLVLCALQRALKHLETFYNPTRRHSSLDYLSPVAFEKLNKQYIKKAA